MKAVLHFDGACRGNPGPSAGAAVLHVQGTASPLTVHGPVFVGTNNESEFCGLIVGLKLAIDEGVEDLTIHGDSKLVCETVAGRWRCRAPNLKPLLEECWILLRRIKTWRIEWIPRERNGMADRASNDAIDKRYTIDLRLM